MKKNANYEINHITNTITVTRKFLQDASIMGTEAFKVMSDLRELHMPIVMREIHHKKDPRWSAKKMECYLNHLEDGKRESYSADYKTIKDTKGYQASWVWFKKTFPEYKKLPELNENHKIVVKHSSALTPVMVSDEATSSAA